MLGALALAASGHLWQPLVSATLLHAAWSSELELWLPFWPFEPFIPLLVLGVGVWVQRGRLSEDEFKFAKAKMN
jgi:RsiW-degrading membrane proteinase PrsW (M82 family)